MTQAPPNRVPVKLKYFRAFYAIAGALFVCVVSNNVFALQTTKSNWSIEKFESAIPVVDSLKFEPTKTWMKNYFQSRESMADEISDLFHDLANPVYRKRKEAQKKIVELPFIPQSLITQGLNAENPEVRFFVKSLARKRQNTERMYLNLTIWHLYKQQIKGFAKQLFKNVGIMESPYQRFMVPIAIASTTTSSDKAEDWLKILEQNEGGSASDPDVSHKIVAIWALTALEKESGKALFPKAMLTKSDLFQLHRGMALLFFKDGTGLPLLVKVLNSDDEQTRVLAEKVLRQTTGKWFGFVGSSRGEDRAAASKAWEDYVAKRENAAISKLDPEKIRPNVRLLGNYLVGYVSQDGKPGMFEIAPDGGVIARYGMTPSYSAEKLSVSTVLATIKIDGIGHVGKVDWKGNVLWQYESGNTLHCHARENGNVVICISGDNKAIEVNQDSEIVWGIRVGEPVNDIVFLPNGDFFVAHDAGVSKFDADRNEQVIFSEYAVSGIELLPDGNLLLASYKSKKIATIDRKGEKKWEFASNGQCVFATRTDDGSYLIASTTGFQKYNATRGRVFVKSGFNGRVFKK